MSSKKSSAKVEVNEYKVYDLKQALSERYTIGEKLGSGSFGTVFSALDKKTNEKFAVKMMRLTEEDDDSEDEENPDRLSTSTVIEVSLLARLSHPNIIRMKEVDCDFNADEIAMVLELADYDLSKLLKRWAKEDKALGVSHKKQRMEFAHQILCGLNYLHSNDILHLDLKPQNILIKDSQCKIADFGLSERLQGDRYFSSSLMTVWWRAPEIDCASGKYSKGSDIWSIGIIFCELFFDINPMSLLDQENAATAPGLFGLQQIFLGGAPPDKWVQKYHGSECKNLLTAEKKGKTRNIKNVVRNWITSKTGKRCTEEYGYENCDAILSLISRCLAWDPDDRATAAELMQHRAFSESGICGSCAVGCVVVKGYHIPENSERKLLPELETLMKTAQEEENGHIEYEILVYGREIYHRYTEVVAKNKNNSLKTQALTDRIQKFFPVILQQIACLACAGSILSTQNWSDWEEIWIIIDKFNKTNTMPEFTHYDLMQLQLQICQTLDFNLDGPFDVEEDTSPARKKQRLH